MKTCASAGVAIIHTSVSDTNIRLKRCVAAGFAVTNKQMDNFSSRWKNESTNKVLFTKHKEGNLSLGASTACASEASTVFHRAQTRSVVYCFPQSTNKVSGVLFSIEHKQGQWCTVFHRAQTRSVVYCFPQSTNKVRLTMILLHTC